jgi:excisionase family DNA binding protein
MVTRARNRMMTSSGVASMLSIHINTVRRWSNQGILKAHRIGPRGDRRFAREDILGLLNSDSYGYKTWKE